MSAAFKTIGQLVQAIENGQTSFCSFRKVPSQTTLARGWMDFSMAAGNPLPNYYASTPLIAATLDALRGIWHGDNKSPARKFISKMAVSGTSGNYLGAYMLLDYLIYYPFIDLDNTDAQLFDNTVTLPRYTSGEDVRPMLVCVAPTTGGGTFQFDYINQNGEAKTSPIQSFPTAAQAISQILRLPTDASAGGPFLNLAAGDRGVRQITSWTNLGSGGGLASLVLAKPLLNTVIYEVSTFREIEFISNRAGLVEIFDGAYLNIIGNVSGGVATATLGGFLEFVWN